MATVYSAWSRTWWPDGADVARKFRARLDYGVSSETDTTIQYWARVYVELNATISTSWTGYLTFDSDSTYSASGKTVYKKDKVVQLVSAKYKTYTKGTSATTGNISFSVRKAAGDISGTTMSSSVGVSIPAKRYEISYNANGGSNPPASQKKVHGTSIALTTGVPTRDGYDFVSWNTAADGSGTSYGIGATFSTNAITTLYAQWHLSYVPPKVEDIRAYRVKNGSSGYNPNVLSTGTKIYAEFKLTNPVSGTVTVSAKFGTTASASSGTDGSIKYFYSSDSHLSTTSSETVTFTLSVTDYKGNKYTYTYTTFISTENYIFDAFKGTSGSTEYQSFAIGGIARDFSNSNRYSKGDFDCYMRPTFYTMAGEIKMWAGDKIPEGWLLCDGSEVSKTKYPNLYAAIGDLWGVPNSSSNFKLPDLSGRVPVGKSSDTHFDTVGKSGGNLGMFYHNHNSRSLTGSWYIAGRFPDTTTVSGIVTKANGKSSYYLSKNSSSSSNTKGFNINATHTHDTQGSSSNTDSAIANVQPYVVVKYIICAI